MRVILQRVRQAQVTVADAMIGTIERGWLALVGITHTDTAKDAVWIAQKIAGLRAFADDDGKMNRSVEDIGAAVLVVSNFTLYADCEKGRRPSFVDAARPEQAKPLYEQLILELKSLGIPVQSGEFGGDMQVTLVNDGPVTLILETPVGAGSEAKSRKLS